MSDPDPLFLEWANQALQHYHLRRPTLVFLGYSDNITFRVDDEATGEQFLLRLHRPRTHTLVGPRQEPLAIQSELHWIDALTRDTAILVPGPIRNRHQELVTLLQFPEGELLPCTLLLWMVGDPFPVDAATAEPAAALGRLLAALHHHSSTWSAPPDFVRPFYDTAFIDRVVINLRLGLSTEVIEPADYDVLQQTLEECSRTIATLPRTPENWGMIHNDLHPGNCLLVGNEVYPIDFSLCGFGYYLFDLATSLGSLNIPLRRPLIEAYLVKRALPDNSIRVIEAFFIISRMSSYGFSLPDPYQQPWLRRRIPQVVETICHPFLQTGSFLFIAR